MVTEEGVDPLVAEADSHGCSMTMFQGVCNCAPMDKDCDGMRHPTAPLIVIACGDTARFDGVNDQTEPAVTPEAFTESTPQ